MMNVAAHAPIRSCRCGKGASSRSTTTIDDGAVFAGVARALAKSTSDRRFADYFKFITEKKSKVYIQRVFDNCTTTRGKDGPYRGG